MTNLFRANGHLYGRLKQGSYLLVVTSAEIEDLSDSMAFKLRIIAPDVTVSTFTTHTV